MLLAVAAAAQSCSKEDTTEDEWQVTGARFINVQIANPLPIGTLATFDYQCLEVNYGSIINGLPEERWNSDINKVATVELSDGLEWHEYDGQRQYRCITAKKYREETLGKDTIYLYIPSDKEPGYKKYTQPVTVQKP